MGSIGDVYEVVDHMLMEGQEVLNVYFYRLDTPVVGNAAEMAVASYIGQVLPDVIAIQQNDVVHMEVSARNLFNESETWSELISEPGDGADDTLPIFNAVGYRLVGSNSAVRDGQKRYAGISEDVVTDGVVDSAGMITLMTTLAATLAAGLFIGLDADALIPVIVGRILESPGVYRLPNNAGEAVLSEIVDALFNVEVTSQTSRKIGSGS